MFGNGAAIGMVTIEVMRKPILRDLNQALTACLAAAVGTSMRRTRASPLATPLRPAFATTALASAWPAK